jgi:hypothetical protein
MTAAILEKANEAMRMAVRERLANTDPSDEKLIGYKLDQGDPEPTPCCEGQRFRGDSLLRDDVHPTSQAFFDLCDSLKEMHRRKSRDYGCPSGEDPLANIRNGAKFVGIPSWKGAMVRLSDKVTRLAAYNATGRLENESLEDNLFDLASYSLLALLLHREEHRDS